MTCKLSSNFFLVLSPPLCLRQCREGAVTGALKCSPSDQQLRGVWRRRGWNVGVSLADSVSQKLCLSLCIHCTRRSARWKIRLTAIIHVYHCYAPHSFLFVPSAMCSSRACLHSVWSTAEPCGALLLTNQTSQCHWAALSKTHGHVSSLNSPAFQCLAGSQAKEL